MNIIFLDIDGVLNCDVYYEGLRRLTDNGGIAPEHPLEDLCPERIELLNVLCERVDAKVVISSTWRLSGLEYCKNALQGRGAKFDIIDVTPKCRVRDYIVRGNEVLAWIKNNEKLVGCWSSDFKTYAIIDDDSDFLYEQRNNLFLVDSYGGLTPNTIYRIERFFKSIRNIERSTVGSQNR